MVLQQDLRILENVSREYRDHHGAATDDAARREIADAGNARRARRLAADSGSIDDGLRVENRGVRHVEHDAVRLPNDAHSPAIRRGIPDANRRRHGLGVYGVALAEVVTKARGERRRPGRLHGSYSRRGVDESELFRLTNCGAERRCVSEIAGGEDDPVWSSPAQLLPEIADERL